MSRLLRALTASAVGLGLAALPALPASAAQRTITYDVTSRGSVQTDLGRFAAAASRALDDPRGWSLGGALEFRRVTSGGDLTLVLASPSAVAAAAPGCSSSWSCRVGDDVLVNDRRWREGTSSWTRSLAEYRDYVVVHEVGHWLGLDHVDCPGPGQPAPVMQQQSISLQGCRANVWPLPEERARVAARFGVTPAAVRDGVAAVRPDGADLVWLETRDGGDAPPTRTYAWGRPTKDDVPVVGDWDGDGVETAGVARPVGRDWVWLLSDAVGAGRLDHRLVWGRPTKDDVPVVGDWDGDGRDTPAVARPEGGAWRWLLNDRLEAPRLADAVPWGRPGKDDRPLPADWDGDGRDTPGVVRPQGAELLWLATEDPPYASQRVLWGRPTKDDRPVVGDWDGDGDETPGVARPDSGVLRWLLTDRTDRPAVARSFAWGVPEDTAVSGGWAP